MELFIFTNQETHAAFKFLTDHAERLMAIIKGSQSSVEQLEGNLAEWLVEERPMTTGVFYDSLLETSLLRIDFQNLADAVQRLSGKKANKRTLVRQL